MLICSRIAPHCIRCNLSNQTTVAACLDSVVAMAASAQITCESIIASVNRVAGNAAPSLGRHQWAIGEHASILPEDGKQTTSAAGLVAFGSNNFVALYDPVGMRILTTMCGHSDRVNGVAWFPKPRVDADGPHYADEREIVSCSSDGTLRVWEFEHTVDAHIGTVPWRCTALLKGHKASVTSVTACVLHDGTVCIASTSTDCTLRVWWRKAGSESWQEAAPYQVRPVSVFECVASVVMPEFASSPLRDTPDVADYGVVIATGGVDSKINLFSMRGAFGADLLHIEHLLTLTGHVDWIRSMEFSAHTRLLNHFGKDNIAVAGDQHLFLATASQDAKVRLWKFARLIGSSAAAVATEVDEAVNDDEDDELNPEGSSSKTTSRLVDNVAHVDALLGLDNPLLAALQRPRRFGLVKGDTKVTYEVIFDAMLSGHDAWVTSVHWHPPVLVSSGKAKLFWQPPSLITSSMDKSIIIWQPSGTSTYASTESTEQQFWSGVWEAALRIGSAGAQVAGLYGAQLSWDGSCVFAHGYQGAIHVWASDALRNNPHATLSTFTDFSFINDIDRRVWHAKPAALGHFGAVTSARWGESGRYLVSTSLDYTTRVWAPTMTAVGSAKHVRWFEVSRPQIHGYEMSAAALPLNREMPHRLVTAGDEKVIRVFDAPKLFLRSLHQVSAAALEATGYAAADWDPRAEFGDRAEFSYVPELGLTNKPVTTEGAGAPIKDRYQIDGRDADSRAADARAAVLKKATQAVLDEGTGADEGNSVGHEDMGEMDRKALNKLKTESSKPSRSRDDTAAPAAVMAPASPAETGIVVSSASHAMGVEFVPSTSVPPLEEDLVQNTRWPETNKLFGHHNEVYCLAVNANGTIIASASKARNPVHATLRLWDAVSGKQLQALEGHKLTVIDLSFSPARSYLSPVAGTEVYAALGANEELPTAAAESEFLVSVSKDRSICIYGVVGYEDVLVNATDVRRFPTYKLLSTVERAHKRIIWGLSWCPLPSQASLIDDAAEGSFTDAGLFATVARDQVVKLWCLSKRKVDVAATPVTSPANESVAPSRKKRDDDDEGDLGMDQGSTFALETSSSSAGPKLALSAAFSFPAFAHAATAVAFSPACRASLSVNAANVSALLAVGLENGEVHLLKCQGHTLSTTPGEWAWSLTSLARVDTICSHVSTVRALAWRPLPASWQDGQPLQLATASSDESLRVFNVAHRL